MFLDFFVCRNLIPTKERFPECKEVYQSSMESTWHEKPLPVLLDHFELHNIFAIEQFQFLHCDLPAYRRYNKGQFAGKSAQYIRLETGKSPMNIRLESQRNPKNIRLSIVLAISACGEKLPMSIAANQKVTNSLVSRSSATNKSAVNNFTGGDSEIFQDMLEELEKKFTKEKRNVAIIMKHCPAGLQLKKFKAIHFVFLPQTTAEFYSQDLFQSIIPSLKKNYRTIESSLRRNHILASQQKSVDHIVVSMQMLMQSWESLFDGILVDAFKKAGICK